MRQNKLTTISHLNKSLQKIDFSMNAVDEIPPEIVKC